MFCRPSWPFVMHQTTWLRYSHVNWEVSNRSIQYFILSVFHLMIQTYGAKLKLEFLPCLQNPKKCFLPISGVRIQLHKSTDDGRGQEANKVQYNAALPTRDILYSSWELYRPARGRRSIQFPVQIVFEGGKRIFKNILQPAATSACKILKPQLLCRTVFPICNIRHLIKRRLIYFNL